LNRKKRNKKQLNTTEEVFNKVIIKIFSTHHMNPWSSTKKKENHYSSRTAKGDYMLIKAGNPKLHMERKKQKILRKLKLLKLMIWTKFIRIHLCK
jgi:hypothetical protein